jgi:hypothetical protein
MLCLLGGGRLILPSPSEAVGAVGDELETPKVNGFVE